MVYWIKSKTAPRNTSTVQKVEETTNVIFEFKKKDTKDFHFFWSCSNRNRV